ncbi:hypothetical protein [Treponema socranskii]|uniref:hypothetical protein n=1 Tax=Treponema socranskii TaxID=53419 RepID=UPI0028E6571E|nr:hypothetical protein [Treponema socranskii]
METVKLRLHTTARRSFSKTPIDVHADQSTFYGMLRQLNNVGSVFLTKSSCASINWPSASGDIKSSARPAFLLFSILSGSFIVFSNAST